MGDSRFKLLVVDVDGTLVGNSGVPTSRVRQALSAAQDRGVRISLCTGRPLASCWPIARELGLRGAHVAFNGALVTDPDSPPAILSRPLPIQPAGEVVEFCRRHELCLELYTEQTHYVERDWTESRLHAISIRVTYEFGDFDDLLAAGGLIKAQIITSDERGRRLAAELAEGMRGRLGLSVAVPMAPCVGCECVNVVDPGVSKGAAVRTLLAHYGIGAAEAIGAGDAPNDLPVFAEVGYRVAMGGGDGALIAVADFVAPSAEEDGLAVAVERLLLGADQPP